MTSPLFLAGIMGLGAPELVVVLVILLVLFGGSKLPSLAKGLGESIREFKKSTRDEPAPAPTAPTSIETKAVTTEAAPAKAASVPTA